MGLCRGLPYSVVLRDREGSFQVLVSNVRLHKRRPRNGCQPLYAIAVPAPDAEWLELFQSRYFVYKVHTSGCARGTRIEKAPP